MSLCSVVVSNFTVFDHLNIEFCDGINVFIGENGTGKTHLMKLLYAASQAARHDVSFSHKLVRLFFPDGMKISRLLHRAAGNGVANIAVSSTDAAIKMTFSNKTKKWDADVTGEVKWEKQFPDMISTFIPAKEILSNARNLTEAVKAGNVDFDDTYLDIIAAAKIDISQGVDPAERQDYIRILQRITGSKVKVNEERFYLLPGNAQLEFPLVAEGIRKIALLWQLIKNGTLENGSILFWDEPEANINPIHIPVLADMLLKLQNDGVQVFIATHDYVLAKYIELEKSRNSKLKFYSLYFDDVPVSANKKHQKSKNRVVRCESNEKFGEIIHNPIMNAFNSLLDSIYKENIG